MCKKMETEGIEGKKEGRKRWASTGFSFVSPGDQCRVDARGSESIDEFVIVNAFLTVRLHLPWGHHLNFAVVSGGWGLMMMVKNKM